MEFGVTAASALPRSEDGTTRAAFDYAVRTAALASEVGFDGVGVAHKYLAGPVHQFVQPLLMAAHILSLYPELYVTTNVYLLPYDNPLRTAEDVATLDMIAPGKFLFGIGQGYRENEAAAFQLEHKERGRRMTEAIAAMRALWAPGSATFEGEFWQYRDAHLSVKPSTPQGPPILLAADKVNSVVKVPERGGDHWLPSSRHSKDFLREAVPAYREALQRAGKPFRGLPIMRDICVAESREAAEAIVEASITDYLHRQSAEGQPGEAYNVDFDQLKHNRLILGTSEEAAEEIVDLHREFGAEYVLFRVYTPGMDQERALDVIRQIGEEVLPLVRKEVGPGNGSIFAPSESPGA